MVPIVETRNTEPQDVNLWLLMSCTSTWRPRSLNNNPAPCSAPRTWAALCARHPRAQAPRAGAPCTATQSSSVPGDLSDEDGTRPDGCDSELQVEGRTRTHEGGCTAPHHGSRRDDRDVQSSTSPTPEKVAQEGSTAQAVYLSDPPGPQPYTHVTKAGSGFAKRETLKLQETKGRTNVFFCKSKEAQEVGAGCMRVWEVRTGSIWNP